MRTGSSPATLQQEPSRAAARLPSGGQDRDEISSSFDTTTIAGPVVDVFMSTMPADVRHRRQYGHAAPADAEMPTSAASIRCRAVRVHLVCGLRRVVRLARSPCALRLLHYLMPLLHGILDIVQYACAATVPSSYSSLSEYLSHQASVC